MNGAVYTLSQMDAQIPGTRMTFDWKEQCLHVLPRVGTKYHPFNVKKAGGVKRCLVCIHSGIRGQNALTSALSNSWTPVWLMGSLRDTSNIAEASNCHCTVNGETCCWKGSAKSYNLGDSSTLQMPNALSRPCNVASHWTTFSVGDEKRLISGKGEIHILMHPCSISLSIVYRCMHL